MKLTPQEAMALAIEEGKKGSGFVSPNPLVGCVILSRDYHFLAKGYHERVGDAHAEINALKAVHDPALLVGAHVFVTLEPCAHKGRTGSCARHLATLPIASVTYGIEDPNPLVSGQGARILREAGKQVQLLGEMQSELEELAEIFLLNMRQRRPFVSLKIASSLDGQVALADGTSQWITGSAARKQVQLLRGYHDAVLTGLGTIQKDNPRLNSRDLRFINKKQKLVILDPSGSLQFRDRPLLQVRSPEDILWITGVDVTDARDGVVARFVPMNDDKFDLSAVLALLMKAGIFSVMIEAGPFTASTFLSSHLVDRLYLFMAPSLIGAGQSWTSGLTIPRLDQALRLRDFRCVSCDEDILATGRLLWS